jgi:hypothetical protein
VGVDRDAQRAERARLGDGGVHAVRVGGVGAEVAHVVQLRLQRLALVVGDVGNHDLHAGGVQPAHSGLAQPAGAADDDRGTLRDLHRSSSSLAIKDLD